MQHTPKTGFDLIKKYIIAYALCGTIYALRHETVYIDRDIRLQNRPVNFKRKIYALSPLIIIVRGLSLSLSFIALDNRAGIGLINFIGDKETAPRYGSDDLRERNVKWWKSGVCETSSVIRGNS